MEKLKFKVNYEKCTQTLNFFANKAGGRINKMKALKLVFFADRYHIRKFGRLLTNDNYVAMEHGPVPSKTKDIAESNDYLDDIIKKYSQGFVDSANNRALCSKNEVDESVFSESDLEALNFAWDTFGNFDQFELRDITHNYPEWYKFKDKLSNGSCYTMDLLDFLKDPKDDYDKCFELTEDGKKEVKEHLLELAHIESLWSRNAGCSA
ncbi:MAG: Panacea domain-containing protein [Dehalococcoidales bacterium]|jgi:uncharacterized phage-associated protein|nr:Panacea domain-containing protein [Dehalococcoidales bacterium]